jgi:hypothetical protein
MDRFGDVVAGAGAEGPLYRKIVFQAGNHQHRDVLMGGHRLQPGASGKAVHHRHHRIHQDHVRLYAFEDAQRLLAVFRLRHSETAP